MGAGSLFSLRSARVIAIARAVQALFLCAALLFAHLPSDSDQRDVPRLVLAYAVFSLAVLIATQRRALAYRLMRVPLFASGVDFALCVTLLYLSSGADSPFFSPWMFLLLSWTVQWGSRGALAVGAMAVAAFAPAGWAAFTGRDPGISAIMFFVLRLGYLLVACILLTAFARHLERVVQELTRLSAPFIEEPDAEPPMEACLDHALRVFQAHSGLIVWGEDEEPYATLLARRREKLVRTRLAPAGEDWLVNPKLARSVFLLDGAHSHALARTETGVVKIGDAVAHSVLASERFDRALVLPFEADGLAGWVFLFDHDEPANEDFAIGSLISAQLSVALERWRAQSARNAAAGAEARIRMARDLHDGVLQFLAAAGLEIEAIMRGADLSETTRDKLSNLKAGMADEQRELRLFITTMWPRSVEPTPPRILVDELTLLADRLRRHWNVNLQLQIETDRLEAPEAIAFDLSRVVREAVANAVRHGRASRIMIGARREGDALLLEIVDNGSGFGFIGWRSDEELATSGVGPRSVMERVRALGGRLRLRSTDGGAHLAIQLPLSRLAS